MVKHGSSNYNVWLFSRAMDFRGNFTNKLEVDTDITTGFFASAVLQQATSV